jgi:hypothetical protein
MVHLGCHSSCDTDQRYTSPNSPPTLGQYIMQQRRGDPGSADARNLVRPEREEKIKLGAARRFGTPIGEIDDFALPHLVDCGMRIVDEALQSFRKPVVAPRLLACAIHALLSGGPIAVVSNDEPVQVEIETILHSRAVNFRYQAARLRKCVSVNADTVADRNQFLRRMS